MGGGHPEACFYPQWEKESRHAETILQGDQEEGGGVKLLYDAGKRAERMVQREGA